MPMWVRVCTVYVDIALLHKLAKLRKPRGGVNFGHVEGAQGRRSMESSTGERWTCDGYIRCSCRVWAPKTAREEHKGLVRAYVRYMHLTPPRPPTPAAQLWAG